VRKRIKQICSGSLEKQSLTLFPVYYDNFSNQDSQIFMFNDVTDVCFNWRHTRYGMFLKQWWRRDKIPDEGFLMTMRLITVSLLNFHTSQPVWEEIDNQRVDHFVLSCWLVNYAIMSQPVGEIRISRYFSRNFSNQDS
jgi:hypothetical protein